MPQINKYLEEWRGIVADPSAFAAAADLITCVQCYEEGRTDPHVFSRTACESTLSAKREKMSQMAAEALRNGTAVPDFSSLLQEICKHGHTAALEHILSSKVVVSAVPCPCCLKAGRSPPYCFDRQQTLLMLTELMLQTSRAGSISCPYCKVAIRILDIVIPDVFFSYNWGFKDDRNPAAPPVWSTQELVAALRPHIERQADVVTWFDVGGGMGAGQSAREEMQQGVLKSTVVVIFISDAYCKSGNCLREYQHAIRHSKFLIPVLVPNKGPVYPNGPSSGWTGPGPEDRLWFQHASSISSSTDPDTGDRIPWEKLEAYTPIDLRAQSNHVGEEKRLQKNAVLEIVKRILSRLHRGQRISHAPLRGGRAGGGLPQ